MNRTLIAAVITATLAACSGSEEDTTPGGTCILSDLTECTQVTGDAATIEMIESDCRADGDTWTSGPCPTEGLIGCCTFHWTSVEQRSCFYPDPERVWDPEAWCAGVSGVWVAAP
jgi:hypothetical protein